MGPLLPSAASRPLHVRTRAGRISCQMHALQWQVMPTDQSAQHTTVCPSHACVSATAGCALSRRYGSVIFINVASSSVRDHWTDLLKRFIKAKEAGPVVGSSSQDSVSLRLDGEAVWCFHMHAPGSAGPVDTASAPSRSGVPSSCVCGQPIWAASPATDRENSQILCSAGRSCFQAGFQALA